VKPTLDALFVSFVAIFEVRFFPGWTSGASIKRLHPSNKIMQKGLAFLCEWSASGGTAWLALGRKNAAPPADR
jgi:hypothetical protein